MKKNITSLLLILVMALSIIACGEKKTDTQADMKGVVKTETVKVDAKTAAFYVGGSCGMCKDRIESTLKGITGVVSAEYNLEKQELELSYDENTIKLDELKKALTAKGHDTDTFKADKAVYEKLPGCCLYRK